ncbi:MAG TPA: esterase-like activity of phytase family protein, partial [Xanthobacteraceae bacterium]|nr:esterase-like activity of phytase family protein [Xanthobacteraceae bacterium]
MSAATRLSFFARSIAAAGWLALALSLTSPAFAQLPPKEDEHAVNFEIRTTPVESFDLRDPQRRNFGALVFRGGIELSSHQSGFGGLSSIRLFDDGTRFVIASDRGRWLRGHIVYDGVRPAKITDAEMAPMLAEDGKPLALKGWFDTESLADDGGIFYVGIERVNEIVRFDFGKDGVSAR